ncbi:MAG: DUF5916 domain-containing protein, partial [Gemmatimonadota bacterium]|nr:DUF5916 domain-containing protein [Gemmatimonadota bacterium]
MGTGLLLVLSAATVLHAQSRDTVVTAENNSVVVITPGHVGKARKLAWATRVSVPPRIDGFPDDSCWTAVFPITDFIQRRPVENDPPSEETEVRIVYDDHAIFFCFTCYDSQPDEIQARLTPRDRISSSDNVRVFLDSYFDQRTAFEFAVNAVNVQSDVLHTDETRRDRSWNSIWRSEVKVFDYGWVAEIEIPFSCLRFGERLHQSWGMNLSRYIQRKKEHLQWRLIGDSDRGFFVSRFGMLGGLESVRPPRRIELLPYATLQVQDNEVMSGDFTRQFGLDLKLGLASNTTLDLTVNPEFGTVETDEEQLNLSPFPTYYREKRPFFLEFQDIFKTGIPLVHSRRIGKPLRNVVNPSATILGGARLVGKTASGLRYGVLGAVVDEEKFYYSDLDIDGEFDSGDEQAYRKLEDAPAGERDKLGVKYLEPQSSYFIGRVSREFGEHSRIGAIATGVSREYSEDFDENVEAYTGGVDWDLALNSAWKFYGQLAGSSVEDRDREKKEGYATRLGVSKFSGEHLGCKVDYYYYSDDFDVNDLGWVYGNEYGTGSLRADVQVRGRPRARGVRSWHLNWQFYRTWADRQLDELAGMKMGNRFNTGSGIYDGGSLVRSEGGNVGGNLQFMNYWNCYFGLGSNFDEVGDPYRAAEDRDFIFTYPVQAYYWAGFGN